MTETNIPSLDFVIDALPAAIGMLDAADQPAIALFAVALEEALKAVQASLAAKGFDMASTVHAADAAALAELRAKFPQKP